MIREKSQFVIAVDDADDAVMFPISRLLSIHHEGDDVIKMAFDPGTGDVATGGNLEADVINLTVPNETERSVTLAILDAINYNVGAYKSKQRNYFTVCNDVDSTQNDVAGITSCTISFGAV